MRPFRGRLVMHRVMSWPGGAVNRTTTPWVRWLLLAVLAFEALGSFIGGPALMASPDGSLMSCGSPCRISIIYFLTSSCRASCSRHLDSSTQWPSWLCSGDGPARGYGLDWHLAGSWFGSSLSCPSADRRVGRRPRVGCPFRLASWPRGRWRRSAGTADRSERAGPRLLLC